MTFAEVIARRIARIRQPQWNEYAYLQLHITASGHIGPWGLLVDPCSQYDTHRPQQILLLNPEVTAGNTWEEYTREPDREHFPDYQYP